MSEPDLFSFVDREAPSTPVYAREEVPTGPRTLTLEIEIPHEEAELVVVRPKYDGSWEVVIADSRGVGDRSVYGRGPNPLLASRQTHAAILKRIETRKTEEARRRTAARPVGGRLPAPPLPYRPNPQHPPSTSPGVTAPSAGANLPGAPRAASVWERVGSGMRVRLKEGYVWPDMWESQERVFQTLRMAKDITRAAIRT